MKENKPKLEGRSKASLIAFWIGKEIKPDIEAHAVKESELTGIALNANGLSKEIFAWAFPVYKQAGSLAALKKLQIAAESTNPAVPQAYIKEKSTAANLLRPAEDAALLARAKDLLDLLDEAKIQGPAKRAKKKQRDRNAG